MIYQETVEPQKSGTDLSDVMEYQEMDYMTFLKNDTRGQHRGKNIPDFRTTGVHSVPAHIRAENESRYLNVWRADRDAPDLDPANFEKTKNTQIEFLAKLTQNALQANKLRDERENIKSTALPYAKQTSLFSGIKTTLTHIDQDIRNWSMIPCNSATDKIKYIFFRDDRPENLLTIIIPCLIVIIFIQFFWFTSGIKNC